QRRRNLPVRLTRLLSGKRALPKVNRIRSRHPCWPPNQHRLSIRSSLIWESRFRQNAARSRSLGAPLSSPSHSGERLADHRQQDVWTVGDAEGGGGNCRARPGIAYIENDR